MQEEKLRQTTIPLNYLSGKWIKVALLQCNEDEKITYITHFNAMTSCSAFEKWPVKKITVICNIYTGFQFLHVRKPDSKKFYLQETPDHMVRINHVKQHSVDTRCYHVDEPRTTSSLAFVTLKKPSNSGFGVYSKSSISSPTH